MECVRGCARFLIVLVFVQGLAPGQSVSPLYERGYSVLPQPQTVILKGGDFRFGNGWQLQLRGGVQANDVAVVSLREDLKIRHGLVPVRGPLKRRAGVIQLALAPKSVAVGKATDRDKGELARQAYRIVLKPGRIQITANAPAGLFYGVETLVQLVRAEKKKFWLPSGEIMDWPDLELRAIFWDDSHHLDRMGELKRALRQAAFFKINGFLLKLEGHFQYRSARAIVEPYALTARELRELTNYGLRYHVQLIPYVDAPGHVSFILKHPEYAALRAFPASNYEFCVSNPATYRLLFGMYDELMRANKGVKYFHLSTDEPYYVGLADNSQCREAGRARELGSPGKLLAGFITRAANYLHARGRTVLFWGEYPLKPQDIPSLPAHVVNGEVDGPEFDPVFAARGIRQMIYTSTQGEEPLFPDYFTLETWDKFHQGPARPARVANMFDYISNNPARKQARLMGVIVAAWADAGLHPETFWEGYAVGCAAGWHPGTPDARESADAFYNLYYGPSTLMMGRVYQMMSQQAQFWEDSWDWTPSKSRKPIFGNSEGVFNPPRPARDQTFPLPSAPSFPNLALPSDWKDANDRRLQLVLKYMVDNAQLLHLLELNQQQVRFHRYNLQVFASIAELCGHNLRLLLGVGRIYTHLQSAHQAAISHRPENAVIHLDRALDIAQEMRQDRNLALKQVTDTWYKTWWPRVEQANGRKFFHELDDVKDHRPDRTVDMSYLIHRELVWSFGEWVEKIRSVRNLYAFSNGFTRREEKLDWSDTTTILPSKGASVGK